MITKTNSRAGAAAVDLGPVVVVVLLTALFAGAILSALQPKTLVDLATAALQGGL